MGVIRRKLIRLKWRWKTWRHTSGDLNRRVDVERVLWDVASGRRSPIESDEARKLALKLGVPNE